MLTRFWRKAQAQAQTFSDRDATIAELVGVAQRLPHDELPDADMRAALVAAIRAGKVIGCYTPVEYQRHTIELSDMPRDLDPRVSVAQWCAWMRAGLDPATECAAAQRCMQALAREQWAANEERARVFLQRQRASEPTETEQSEQGGR